MSIRKLLVIRLGAMGDLIHMSPSLRAVKEHCQIEVHLITLPVYQPLVETFGVLDKTRGDKTWGFDKRWKGLFQLAGELRAEHFDAAVNLHPSLKTRLLLTLAGISPVSIYQKEKLAITGERQRGIPRLHAAEDFYRPFQRLLDLPGQPDLTPALSLSGPAAVDRIGIIPGVGGKRGNRAWPVENYRTLIQTLLASQPGLKILLFGGPDEAGLAEALADYPEVENHCGAHNILATARLMQTCRVMVGGDTGPLHLAAALGIPVIGLFGPTSTRRTGPLGRQTDVLTPDGALACWPCELPTCPLTGGDHLACMKQITVDTVADKCLSLLEPIDT